jgi:uncharacterized protein with FMN-binding domain
MKIWKTGRKRKLIWRIILLILAISIIGIMIALLVDAPSRKELKELKIENVDFTNLKDGIFIGEYNVTKGDSRNAIVEVVIKEGKITEIKIRKGALDKEGNPVKMTNNITMSDLFQNVIHSQSLQVDAISGATLSSKAHLKALENALRQATKEENR